MGRRPACLLGGQVRFEELAPAISAMGTKWQWRQSHVSLGSVLCRLT